MGLELETGDVAFWEVGGAGDGRPTHAEYLEEKWGRELRLEDGDIVGLAHWVVLESDNRLDEIVIEAHYDSDVPADVVKTFSSAFPGITISVAA